MASAAEQLAANFNFGSIAKATELKQRLWFTLGALVVYRIGTYIPLPGIDPTILSDIFDQQRGLVLLSTCRYGYGAGPAVDLGQATAALTRQHP